MFIFAHLFAGALLGLVIWHLTNERWAVPLCMAGSILPDLIDKPLGLLFPADLGGGRTVFHALVIVLVILLCMLPEYRSPSRWLVGGVACTVLLHQVMDEMWLEPPNWFWPLLGPFQGQMIPHYLGIFFWREITNPSEWIFMTGSVLILLLWYHCPAGISGICHSIHEKNGVTMLFAVVLLVTGIYLVITVLLGATPTFITPGYDQVPTVIAGVLALSGTFVLSRGKRG